MYNHEWERIFRSKKNHNHGCTDPFCSGCHGQYAPNSSYCVTVNVKIIKRWNIRKKLLNPYICDFSIQ